MNQRAIFLSPANASAQLALAELATQQKTRHKAGLPAGSAALAAFSGPGSGSVDLAFGWGSDPAGLVPDPAGPAFGRGFGPAGHRLGCPAGFAAVCWDFVRLPSLRSPLLSPPK
jgi:hypothetical protein